MFNYTLSEMINFINLSYGTNHKDFRFLNFSSFEKTIEFQLLENNNNSFCIRNENLKFNKSIILFGNSRLNELVNIYKDIVWLRFIFDGEELYPNNKVTIVELYDAGQYQKRNLVLSINVSISEMLKSYNLMYGHDKSDFYYLFNGNKLQEDETHYKKR